MLTAPLRPLTALPREARDTLFLLAVIGWVVGLQAAHLPLWSTALALGVLVWRGALALQSKSLPGWAWRVGLLGLALGATWLGHGTLVGRDAGVTLIVALLSLKTLELRARRDAFVIFFLGFFTLLTHFFYSQSLLTALGVLLALWGLLTALVNAHMPVGHPPLWHAARTAGWLALVGTPLMLALFTLFPRIGPLWGIPSDGLTGRSGLSGEMTVGTIAQLALDDSVALRIRFDSPRPPQRELYFRGPVFSRFDGREWRPIREGTDRLFPLPAQLKVEGEPVRYQVTLEPSSRPWLIVLDATATPPVVPGLRPFMGEDLQWQTRRPITDIVRYDAVSHPRFRHGPDRFVPELQDYLELPPGFNPRTLQLAQDLKAEAVAQAQRQGVPLAREALGPQLVEAALQRLRTGGYTYTLEPGVFGQHTADEFWFDRRQGFCEHIASAFVVLMRALDLPARVVTGYQGGDVNPVDGYWTVRNSDAHAWTEVWLGAQGWVRVDPTTAVAPGRTGSFQPLRPAPGLLAEALITVNPTLASQLRAAWEAVNNRWNQWVLNYTQSKQFDLLQRLGVESPSWRDLAQALAALLGLAALIGATWALWERRRQDPWQRLLRRARQRLRATGLAVPEHATPRQLAQLLQASGAASAADLAARAAVRDWLLRLEAQRYDPTARDSLRALQQTFRRLPWPTPTHRPL